MGRVSVLEEEACCIRSMGWRIFRIAGCVHEKRHLWLREAWSETETRGSFDLLAKKSEEPSASQTSLEDAYAGRSIHVTSGRVAALTAPLKASSRISASALKVVTAEHTSDKSLLASVETVTFEKIDQNVLVNLVSEGKWKPDFEKPQLPKKWYVKHAISEPFFILFSH